jgi:hypothetical protein
MGTPKSGASNTRQNENPHHSPIDLRDQNSLTNLSKDRLKKSLAVRLSGSRAGLVH